MILIKTLTNKTPSNLQLTAMAVAAFNNGCTNSKMMSPSEMFNNVRVSLSAMDGKENIRVDESKMEIYVFSQGIESNTVILSFM